MIRGFQSSDAFWLHICLDCFLNELKELKEKLFVFSEQWNEGKMINCSFLYFQKASLFRRWGNHTDDSTIHSVILLFHATSVENNKSNFCPLHDKNLLLLLRNYQLVETHFFRDNLALKILLIAFMFNWIARTEYTQVIWFPVL